MILAGDIGGTSARLGFFEIRNGKPFPVAECTYRSQQYKGLDDIATDFMESQRHKVRAACFGIAGPVRHGRVVTPNLAWVVDSRSLAQELGLARVNLLNDLEANAYGIAMLDPEDLVTLNPGATDASGNQAVLSVGTGLGEAGLFWDGKTHRPFACEGGHGDFAPRDELEAELLLWMWSKYGGHISYERVLSGPGLLAIYEFLRDTGKIAEEPEVVRAMAEGDASAVVSRTALDGRDELCMKALDMFVSFYGAESGNLALQTMATGGMFIGGGIAPKILQKLQGPGFMTAFTEKGRMKPLLQAMPVRVIIKDTAALLGAARFAAMA
jgi:glucokinase